MTWQSHSLVIFYSILEDGMKRSLMEYNTTSNAFSYDSNFFPEDLEKGTGVQIGNLLYLAGFGYTNVFA